MHPSAMRDYAKKRNWATKYNHFNESFKPDTA